MRFNPVKEPVFFPGSNGEGSLARKILTNSQISFKEMQPSDEMSGFPNTHPMIVVSGRPYYGLEKIKQASMNILLK